MRGEGEGGRRCEGVGRGGEGIAGHWRLQLCVHSARDYEGVGWGTFF